MSSKKERAAKDEDDLSSIHKLLSSLIPALKAQIGISLGLGFSLVVSAFYLFIKDPRFPEERPMPIIIGLYLSLMCFLVGNILQNHFFKEPAKTFSLKRGAVAVLFTWMLSCGISAIVFVLAGFPDPSNVEKFSLFRRFVDGFYESMSGFTTAGTSILPSVEAFPRGILMWRSTTHLIGGMGMAYMAITIIRQFWWPRSQILNGEAETPTILEFSSDTEVRQTGFDFMKIYGLITGIMIVLLFLSGMFFRQTPYQTWYDNVYDSFNHSFSTMGTGGFSTYDTSAGLPITDPTTGIKKIGGLQNPVSEWIIAIFMFIAGGNFALWYAFAFGFDWKKTFNNLEFRVYFAMVFLLSLIIAISLWIQPNGQTIEESLRYAFFNVNTVTSTTGLANQDFTAWPAVAQGLLFICYIVGGMVGSTAGGLKVARFIIAAKYSWAAIKNLIYGKKEEKVEVDGIVYNQNQIGLILVNMMVYFLIFFTGGILLMVMSPIVNFADGTSRSIDFVSAFTSSIANLGDIGPAVAVGSVNAGPTGNYFAYSEAGKIILAVLMFIGRIGVLSFLMLFITPYGEDKIENVVEVAESHVLV